MAGALTKLKKTKELSSEGDQTVDQVPVWNNCPSPLIPVPPLTLAAGRAVAVRQVTSRLFSVASFFPKLMICTCKEEPAAVWFH